MKSVLIMINLIGICNHKYNATCNIVSYFVEVLVIIQVFSYLWDCTKSNELIEQNLDKNSYKPLKPKEQQFCENHMLIIQWYLKKSIDILEF